MSSSAVDIDVPSLGSRTPPKKVEDPEKLVAQASRQDSVRGATVVKSGDLTERRLKSRHVQLIGIGGTIGTALYVQYVLLVFHVREENL